MALVPFDDRDGWIWWDGAMVPWRDAKLHVLSHGLHYAAAVFEGERAYSGNIFRLRAHTDRLINSARILGFEIPTQPMRSMRRATAVLKRTGGGGLCPPDRLARDEMLAVSAQLRKSIWRSRSWPWPSYFGDGSDEGHPPRHGGVEPPTPETAPTASKATGLYMIGTMSKHKAEAEGYDDALMLDWRGHIAEATGANIFFVMDGELHTPDPDCFLDGITRRA